MDKAKLLEHARAHFQQETARIRSLAAPSASAAAGTAAVTADPTPTFTYTGYLDVEGFYFFHMDVMGLSSADLNFHGSGHSWIVGVAGCEVVGQMSQSINQLNGATVDFTLTIGALTMGGVSITFNKASDGSLLGTLNGVAQGAASGHASGSGTFDVPS